MAFPKKRLSQHFLSDSRILSRIADALEPGQPETVIEIGAGPGGLTAVLAERVDHLVAIEKDPELARALRQRFPRLQVVEADALETDWPGLAGQGTAHGHPTYSVIGNIPYHITSPLIDKALLPPRPRQIVFLVQKEVAGRVAAGPGGADYGALSVGVQAVARVERLFTVPAGAFHPRPRVDSAVLRLVPLWRPAIQDHEVGGFRRFVVGLFGFRRKQLIRGLREFTGWSGEEATARLKQAVIPESARPQQLSPAEFVRLYRVVQSDL